MAEYEKAISGKVVHWLPKSELPEAGLPWIMNGDIIAITTKMPGLDIAHVGIAEYKEGKLHLLHASSTLGKVVVSDEPLNHMLNNNKSWTGIRVVRMSHSKITDYETSKTFPSRLVLIPHFAGSTRNGKRLFSGTYSRRPIGRYGRYRISYHR